jgi:AhpD family alkylhydroperoxidase
MRMNGGMLGIEWAPCLLERQPDRDIEAFARRELGIVPPDLPYLTPCPWLARAAVTFHQRLASRLDPHLADAIALVVSHENSCRYCYATLRALLRIEGMSEARVQELEARLQGRLGLDPTFTLIPQPAAPIKGIAEPIVTFAVV